MEGNRHVGRALIVAFTVMTALKEVISGSLVRNHDPLLLVFVAFSCSSAVFLILRRRGADVTRVAFRDNVGVVVVLNLVTVLAWGTVYFALQYLAPAVASTLAVATLPLFSTLLNRGLNGPQPTGRIDIVAAVVIGLAALWLSVIAWSGGGIVSATGQTQLMLAFGACVLSGLGMAASNILASRLYGAGWRPVDVMAYRFLLLVVVAGGLWAARGSPIVPVAPAYLVVVVAYGFGAIALPLFILQTGLKRASPVEAGAIISLSPMLVLVFQGFDPQIRMPPGGALCVGTTVCLVVVHILLRDLALRARARAGSLA